MSISYLLNIVLVAFAFGFVIFWHELGHFLAARWAGVRVEQFAVGMGHAIFSWRKGIGLRLGNTQADFEQRTQSEFVKRQGQLSAQEQRPEPSLRERYDIARDLGIGETEYRFNWIPLGGYVKPTGQDDLRPTKEVGADDPHAFGAKPVSKRMVIISAGVVMNVILAFVLYVVLFRHGFKAPPAIVGDVLPGSPAEAAGIQSGDKILSINGAPQQDYTKLRMNIALLRSDTPAQIEIERPGIGKLDKPLLVTPASNQGEFGLPAIGVTSAQILTGPDELDDKLDDFIAPDVQAMAGKAQIIKINGRDVSAETDDHLLTAAVKGSKGRPVPIVLRQTDGKERDYIIHPTLMRSFIEGPITVAGMEPRVQLVGLQKDSPANKAGLRPGDIVEQVAVVGTGEPQRAPSIEKFMEFTQQAAKDGRKVRINLIRDGVALDPVELEPTFKIDRGHRGIGVLPGLDMGQPVVASVAENSPAARAGLQSDDQIIAINQIKVGNWAEVINGLRSTKDDVTLHVKSINGERDVKLAFNEAERQSLANLQFTHGLPLAPLMTVRYTPNLLVAADWGWEETKASILQVYLTIRRLFEGSVPLSNLSGPIGIFTAGTSAASHGVDWLIWFAALISANLAVVNFLPIPIVDGGLFTFLCIEKLTGRPPSPRIQAAAQIVGIVLLGSLFLFVTYHDILRQWG